MSMKTFFNFLLVSILFISLSSCNPTSRVQYVYVPQPAAVNNTVNYSTQSQPQTQSQSQSQTQQVYVQNSVSKDCAGMAINNKYRAAASGRSTDKTTAREIATNRARGILATQLSTATSRAVISDAESKAEVSNINFEDVVTARAKQTLIGAVPICVDFVKDGAVYEYEVCIEINPSDAVRGMVKVLPDDIRLNSQKLKKFEDNFKNEMNNAN